jgi:endonuclease/exonuclease/phosphatase (EEP) superfamily protein YafD
LFLIFAALTFFLVVASVLPLLPFSHGIVRVGDFPRQQFLAVAAVLLLASIFIGGEETGWRVVQMALAAVVVIQAPHILRYTPVWRRQTSDAKPEDEGERIRLVSSNVKMGNTHYRELADEIAAADPDILVLMEVDEKWRDGVADLLARYEHIADATRDNSYGMIVASRFAFKDVQVEELLTDGIPSVIATIKTPKGNSFRAYFIHPEPPVPHRGTEGRDGETALVALKVKDEKLPVIVTGDLNDVAWSVTTERFRKISGLLDPRIGRRIFSTFDARFPLLRWPLDHLFHSGEFRLIGMKRLKPCGSDHFPVCFELLFCRSEKAESEPEAANGDDIAEARDVVKEARERDEEAIGTDWEK